MGKLENFADLEAGKATSGHPDFSVSLMAFQLLFPEHKTWKPGVLVGKLTEITSHATKTKTKMVSSVLKGGLGN